jgi:outer membrane protein, heavy metal efflux system
MRQLVRCLSFLVVSALARGAAAEAPPSTDLAALLTEAEQASPELLALGARVEAAREGAPFRSALPDPKLSAVYTNDGLDQWTLGESEFSNLSLGWEQEMPYRKVRRRAAAVAEADVEVASAGARSARARLRERIVTLYTALWRSDREAQLLEDARGLFAALAESARVRYEAGEGIQQTVLLAQIEARRVDVLLDEVVRARRAAEIELGAALGRNDDPRFGPTLDLPTFALPDDPAVWTEAAVAEDPDVLLSRSRERRADAAIDDAQIQTKPTWSWLAAYQNRGSLDPMVVVGTTVRLPIRPDRRQAHAVAQATLERRASGQERAQAEIDARARVRDRIDEIASLERRARLYREAIVPQAEAALAAAHAAIGVGRAPMALGLESATRLIADRRALVALDAERIRAVATIERALGRPLLDLGSAGRSR